jgi:hypothetical protein
MGCGASHIHPYPPVGPTHATSHITSQSHIAALPLIHSHGYHSSQPHPHPNNDQTLHLHTHPHPPAQLHPSIDPLKSIQNSVVLQSIMTRHTRRRSSNYTSQPAPDGTSSG